jgi:hypothetical protein
MAENKIGIELKVPVYIPEKMERDNNIAKHRIHAR